MKKFVTHISRGRKVDQESPDLQVWERHVRNLSAQNLRNTGRIEQLEAGQVDLREKFEQILTYLGKPSWKTEEHTVLTNYVYRVLFREQPDISRAVSKWLHYAELSDLAETYRAFIEPTSKQRTLPYHDRLLEVTKLFADLEQDFDDVPRRIIRCELLEKKLTSFEDSLEGDETECLAWYVSLVRDVLDYNYAEDLTGTHLGLLKKAIELIHDKSLSCNKEDCQKLHKEFLQAGLSLIPTTQKAIDNYGE